MTLGLGLFGAIAGRKLGAVGDAFDALVVAQSTFGVPTDKSAGALDLQSFGHSGFARDSRFGNGSYYGGFASNSSAVPGIGSNNAASAMDLSDDDFTIELWVRTSDLTSDQSLISHWFSGGRGWQLYSAGAPRQVRFRYSTDGIAIASAVAAYDFDLDPLSQADFGDDEWHHVTAYRENGFITVAIDGVEGSQVAAVGTDVIFNPVEESFIIGGDAGGSAAKISPINYWRGDIDEARVTVGTARYSADFTPPAEPFGTGVQDPDFSDVVLLVSFDAPFGMWGEAAAPITRGIRTDLGGRNHSAKGLETYGDGDGTIYFEPDDPTLFDFGSGDFTIEIFGFEPKSLSNESQILGVYHKFRDSSWKIEERSSGQVDFLYTTDGVATAATRLTGTNTVLTVNTAVDLTIERAGNDLRFYMDGVMTDKKVLNATIWAEDETPLGLGGETASGGGIRRFTDAFYGGFRVTKAARYGDDAGYTVPSLPLAALGTA